MAGQEYTYTYSAGTNTFYSALDIPGLETAHTWTEIQELFEKLLTNTKYVQHRLDADLDGTADFKHPYQIQGTGAGNAYKLLISGFAGDVGDTPHLVVMKSDGTTSLLRVEDSGRIAMRGELRSIIIPGGAFTPNTTTGVASDPPVQWGSSSASNDTGAFRTADTDQHNAIATVSIPYASFQIEEVVLDVYRISGTTAPKWALLGMSDTFTTGSVSDFNVVPPEGEDPYIEVPAGATGAVRSSYTLNPPYQLSATEGVYLKVVLTNGSGASSILRAYVKGRPLAL